MCVSVYIYVIYVCVCVRMYIMYVCVNVYMYVIYVCVPVCMYVYMYGCTYLRTCVYTYTVYIVLIFSFLFATSRPGYTSSCC